MDLIGIVAIVGGLILAAVLLFAVVANRRRPRDAVRRTETATKDLYAKVDRQDKISDPDTKPL